MSDALLPMRPRSGMPAEFSVVGRTGMSPGSIYRLIADKAFPGPIKIGASSLWPASEVDAWVEKIKSTRHVKAA